MHFIISGKQPHSVYMNHGSKYMKASGLQVSILEAHVQQLASTFSWCLSGSKDDILQ